VCDVPAVNLVGIWLQMSHYIFAAEAVAHRADAL
jgi:hypothetical protein